MSEQHNKTMHILDTLAPDRCKLGLGATSRKKALQLVANGFSHSHPEINSFEILQALTEREQLGSTAIGNGIALPHTRLKSCRQPIALLITLQEGIDFFAADKENVDIIFTLLVPSDIDFRDLKGIELVKAAFSNKTFCAQIRNAHNNEALFDIIESAFKELSNNSKEETS